MDQPLKMESTHREQLIRKRAVAKGMLTRMQAYIDSGNFDTNQIQVRLNRLPTILSKFEAVQDELEASDDFDHTDDRASFETQYFEIEVKFHELLHNMNSDTDRSSNHGSSNTTRSTHSSSAQIRLHTIEIPCFDGNVCKWLHYRDTFQALIIDNKVLSDVQKFHYLISSLKDEAKMLILNLPVTNDNFTVAWDLVTQRYNNIKLIAMNHAKLLVQMPLVKKGDASSLGQLINHVSSHTNAIQALTLNASMHDLILNHLLLSVLDLETHKEWERQTSRQQDIPSTAKVIEFLEDKCKALELAQANQSTGTTPTRYAQQPGSKVSQSKCYLTTHVQCPSCKEPHRLFRCNNFLRMQPKQRFEFAKQIRACFNCLQPYTRNHTCSQGTS